MFRSVLELPWVEIATVGVATVTVAYAIGRFNGADNMKKKKKQTRGGPGAAAAGGGSGGVVLNGGGGMMDDIQDNTNLVNLLFEKATKAAAKKDWREAEYITREGLAMIEQAMPEDSSETAFIRFILNSRLVDYLKKQNKIRESEHLSVSLLEILAQKLIEGETLSGSQEQDVTVFSSLINDFDFGSYHPDRDRAAQIWLEVAEKFSLKPYIIVSSCFLAGFKIIQDKYVEAEAYCKRALSEYSPSSTKEELWFRCQSHHLEALANQPGKEEEANQVAEEVMEFIMTSAPPLRRGVSLANFGDRLFDMGIYDQAEIAMKAAHNILVQEGDDAQSATVAAGIATLLAQSGRLDLAREQISEVRKQTIAKSAEPPMPISKYLQTTSAIVQQVDGKTYAHIALSCRQQKSAPPVGSFLVFHFEHPSSGQEPLDFEHIITEDDEFEVKIPLPHVSRTMYIVEVSVFSDPTKRTKLGTHFVICQSNLNISPDGVPTRTETTTDTILAGDDTQTVTTVKTTQLVGDETTETIVKTTQFTNGQNSTEKTETSTTTTPAGQAADRGTQADLAAIAVDMAVTKGVQDTSQVISQIINDTMSSSNIDAILHHVQDDVDLDDEVDATEAAIIAQLKKKHNDEQRAKQAELLEQAAGEIDDEDEDDDEEEVSLLTRAAPENS